MLEQSNRQDRLTVLRLLGFQAVLVATAGLLGLMIDTAAALSLILGGGIGLLGNSWMALVVFRPASTPTPERLVWGLYVGEAAKFLFVMAFFAIAFKTTGMLAEPRNAMLLFASFVVNQMTVWLWPVFAGTAPIERHN